MFGNLARDGGGKEQESCGGEDTKDYYKFNVTEAVSFRAAISSAVGGLTLSVFNNQQQLVSTISPNEFGVLELDLDGGDYFLLIESGGAAGAYYLELGLA